MSKKSVAKQYAELKQNIESGKYSFNMYDGEDIYYSFAVRDVGKAKYIYGYYSWSKDYYSDINAQLKLCAIFSDSKLYIVNSLAFGHYINETVDMPDIVMFGEYVKTINNEANKILKEFYGKLEVKAITNKEELENIKELTRLAVFFDNDEEIKINHMFNEQKAADILCGLIDLNDEINVRLQKDKVSWTDKKSEKAKIEEFRSNPKVIAFWERKLAEGLRSVDAETVLVEFAVNGKKAAARTSPDDIIRLLAFKECFDTYNFDTNVSGIRLFEELGVDNSFYGKNHLKCEHISKITYRKKVLYNRDSIREMQNEQK